jgi:hypothetical protein
MRSTLTGSPENYAGLVGRMNENGVVAQSRYLETESAQSAMWAVIHA